MFSFRFVPKCFDLLRNGKRLVSSFSNNISKAEFDKLLSQVSMLSQQIQIINQKLSPPINKKLIWRKKDINTCFDANAL